MDYLPTPHETDNDIVSEKRKPCQPKNWVNRAHYLNCIADLVIVAIHGRSFLPPVSTPAADGVVAGFNVGSGRSAGRR